MEGVTVKSVEEAEVRRSFEESSVFEVVDRWSKPW